MFTIASNEGATLLFDLFQAFYQIESNHKLEFFSLKIPILYHKLV